MAAVRHLKFLKYAQIFTFGTVCNDNLHVFAKFRLDRVERLRMLYQNWVSCGWCNQLCQISTRSVQEFHRVYPIHLRYHSYNSYGLTCYTVIRNVARFLCTVELLIYHRFHTEWSVGMANISITLIVTCVYDDIAGCISTVCCWYCCWGWWWWWWAAGPSPSINLFMTAHPITHA